MHILTYEEMELRYIKHVRFWNYILDSEQIRFCFFSTVPHTAWEYTIYALAKVKEIPTLLIDEHWIPELCSVATDICKIGESAVTCFKKHDAIPMDYIAQAFYDKVIVKHASYSDKEKEEALNITYRWRKETFFKPIPKML